MKNLLQEKPTDVLNGRLRESVTYVKDEDVKDREILDIGCGFGWSELNFLNRGVKKVVGIEITSEDIKAAEENISDPRAEFKIAGATSLPFPDNSFDTAVCWEVIEHIPVNTELQMFSEVSRVLRKDGVLYLSTPFDSFFSKILDPGWWLIGHRHYSIEQLGSYAEKYGMTVEHHQVRGKWFSISLLLNMYFSKWLLRRRPLFHSFFIDKQNTEYKSGEGMETIFVKFRKK